MTDDEKRKFLNDTIREEGDALHRIIRSYVGNMRLAVGDEANAVARDVLSETVIAALKDAARYDPTRRPIPWLLGIAIRRIQRRIQQRDREKKRIIPIRDLYASTEAQSSDAELFDHIGQVVETVREWESEQRVAALLAPLSEAEREILRMAVLQDLDARTIGAQLGITPTAARVRLHRSLKRLRNHLATQEPADDAAI